MAETTEKLKPTKVKYKFGADELDLLDYIDNLEHNVQGYLDHQKWNDGLKEEFSQAYRKILSAYLDLLKNNSGRFSTDSLGWVTDTLGEFSNKDNDDLKGLEYYYDNNGNRITTDDYNALKKRKQKNYNTFQANREVANFFNTVGRALAKARTSTTSTTGTKKFSLTDNGFERQWLNLSNPSGGDFDFAPYVEKDALDENGVRGTSERAKYLRELLLDYLNNLEDFDYSGSPFKDRDTYTKRIQAAIDNLANGYNSEDTIALQLAGLSSKFLNSFFANGATKSKTEAELAAEDIKQMQKKLEEQLIIDLRDLMAYESERDAYFKEYLKNNPFNSTIDKKAITSPYNIDAVGDYVSSKYKVDKADSEAMLSAIKEYLNLPQFSNVLRGKQKIKQGNGLTDITSQYIGNNLDLMYLSGLLSEKIGDTGYYVVPGSENYDNWSYIAYNPITRLYLELSMLLNDELKKRMAYTEYDRRNKVTKLENGGIIKHLAGGWLTKYTEAHKRKLQENQQRLSEIKLEVKETGKSEEQVKAGKRRTSETGFDANDITRLSAAAADVVGAIASFVPIYGTATSAGLGLASTGANFIADWRDDSVSVGEMLGNAGIGLGMDLIGLLPGIGMAGKAGKIARTLKPLVGTAGAFFAAKGLLGSREALNKLMSNPSDMTVNDWKDLSVGLLAIAGAGRTAGGYKAARRMKKATQNASTTYSVETDKGNIKLSAEQYDRFKKADNLTKLQEIINEVDNTAKLNSEYLSPWRKARKFKPRHKNPGVTKGIDWNLKDWSKEEYLPWDFKVENGKVTPRKFTNAWFYEKQNRPAKNQGWWFKLENPLYNPTPPVQPLPVLPSLPTWQVKRNNIDKRIQYQFDTNPNFVFRKEGGTLDLNKVRKFLNGGTPDWYLNNYKFHNLTGWNNTLDQSKAGASITNSNAGHYKANNLDERYAKNQAYISNPDLVRLDLQSYYNSTFKGKSLEDYVSGYNTVANRIRSFWNLERTYNETGATSHNQDFKSLFTNRSDNSNSPWSIGYDARLEDIIGSSTHLRDMDRYEKKFEDLSDEEKKARIHKIDLGNGNVGYVYKKANGDIGIWNPTINSNETPVKPTVPTNPTTKPADTTNRSQYGGPKDTENLDVSSTKTIPQILSEGINKNPTAAYGLIRAMLLDRANRRMTDMAKESLNPLLKDPFEVHRYTRSDLDAEMLGERNYAGLRLLASRPITSDGNLLTAALLQAEVQGLAARTAGKEKSNLTLRLYDELAWLQEKENAANRHETAMFNRALQWGALLDKAKLDWAYLSKRANIWDTFALLLEYEARVKQRENKALNDRFAQSDISQETTYNLAKYAPELSAAALDVWNQVVSGNTTPSLLLQDPAKWQLYQLAMKALNLAETELLRRHYGISQSPYGRVRQLAGEYAVSIKRRGGKVDSQIAVAGIRAKTADAERFQRQIKECIDRNEKAIDRLSKSLYGIIKASILK